MKVVIILVIAVAMVTTFFSSGTEAGVIPNYCDEPNKKLCEILKDRMRHLILSKIAESPMQRAEIKECLRNAKNDEAKRECFRSVYQILDRVLFKLVDEVLRDELNFGRRGKF